MTQPVITNHGNLPDQVAPGLMRQEHIRRFYVVDRKGALTGDVSEGNLNHASATSARYLSVWELDSMITQIEVETGMSFDVISVTRMPSSRKLPRACGRDRPRASKGKTRSRSVPPIRLGALSTYLASAPISCAGRSGYPPDSGLVQSLSAVCPWYRHPTVPPPCSGTMLSDGKPSIPSRLLAPLRPDHTRRSLEATPSAGPRPSGRIGPRHDLLDRPIQRAILQSEAAGQAHPRSARYPSLAGDRR